MVQKHTFQRNIVHSSSKDKRVCLTSGPLQITALCSIRIEGTVYPVREGHIPKEQAYQLLYCEDIKTGVKLTILWRPEI
jgi:hypothetical protein